MNASTAGYLLAGLAAPLAALLLLASSPRDPASRPVLRASETGATGNPSAAS